MTGVLVAGTRRSNLALVQTQQVVDALHTLEPGLDVQVRHVVTQGDRTQGPLHEAGKGAFTGALEAALLDGHIDLAVHSLKDLPIASPPGLLVAAVLNRDSARDILITATGTDLEHLEPGSRVGTSSQRRRAQLKAYRSDLNLVPIRGNVDTRVRKLERGEVDALVLAEAGLVRLGMIDLPHIRIDSRVMLPAPGQGALAVQCHEDNLSARRLLQKLDCPKARKETVAERAFLRSLGGGCSMPVGAGAEWNGKSLSMEAMVMTRDGSRVIRVEGKGHNAQALGTRLAKEAIRQGAMEILQHA